MVAETVTLREDKIKQLSYVYSRLKEQTQQIQLQIWVSLLGNTNVEIPIYSQIDTCRFSLQHYFGMRKFWSEKVFKIVDSKNRHIQQHKYPGMGKARLPTKQTDLQGVSADQIQSKNHKQACVRENPFREHPLLVQYTSETHSVHNKSLSFSFHVTFPVIDL